jgi:hypothetical protein
VEFSESISWRIPTYRISDREIKEIFAPIYSAMVKDGDGRKREVRRDDGTVNEC